MLAIQLDAFKSQEECEMDALRLAIRDMKQALDRQRKCQFARIGEMTKEVIDLKGRLEVLERNICKKSELSYS